MDMALGSKTKTFMRVAAVLIAAGTVSACSSVPDWVDPTTWIGSSNDNSQTADNSNSSDTLGTGNNVGGDATAVTTGGSYPDLANMPQRPTAPTTADDQKQVSDSLAADRSHNQYAADQLRAGTEAAAPPPPPPGQTPPQVASVDETPPPPPPAASSDAGATDSSSADNSAPPSPAPAPATQVASLPAPAAAGPAPGAQPAVPAVPQTATGYVPGMQMAQPTDAQLGFKPSTAPPLDASVAQFVATPIINRYRQTASVAPGSAVGPNSSGPAVALNTPPGTRAARLGTGETDVGGPEAMGGAVVANFDALQGNASPASVYASPSGMPPTQVVMFPHDTTVLSAEGRAKVREAYQAFVAAGGQGYIRVVGHSSSRTANMPLQRHLLMNFEKSQTRANAVAKALIAMGVPANKVLVEAVGDSQPVYYESMPQGEEGNRRAEIFVQG